MAFVTVSQDPTIMNPLYSEPCFLVLLTPAQSLGQKLPRCWHISRAPTLVYRDHLHPGFDPKVSSYNWG